MFYGNVNLSQTWFILSKQLLEFNIFLQEWGSNIANIERTMYDEYESMEY